MKRVFDEYYKKRDSFAGMFFFADEFTNEKNEFICEWTWNLSMPCVEKQVCYI